MYKQLVTVAAGVLLSARVGLLGYCDILDSKVNHIWHFTNIDTPLEVVHRCNYLFCDKYTVRMEYKQIDHGTLDECYTISDFVEERIETFWSIRPLPAKII